MFLAVLTLLLSTAGFLLCLYGRKPGFALLVLFGSGSLGGCLLILAVRHF